MMDYLQKDLSQRSTVAGVYLHMHVLNEIGMKFYQACGFKIDERLDNYYTDLEEPHCYILLKEISHEKKDEKKEEKKE